MAKPNVTLREFLDGETLQYVGADGRATEATYRAGVGTYVERDGEDLGVAAVVDDAGARRAYHNLTRGREKTDDGSEED